MFYFTCDRSLSLVKIGPVHFNIYRVNSISARSHARTNMTETIWLLPHYVSVSLVLKLLAETGRCFVCALQAVCTCINTMSNVDRVTWRLATTRWIWWVHRPDCSTYSYPTIGHLRSSSIHHTHAWPPASVSPGHVESDRFHFRLSIRQFFWLIPFHINENLICTMQLGYASSDHITLHNSHYYFIYLFFFTLGCKDPERVKSKQCLELAANIIIFFDEWARSATAL